VARVLYVWTSNGRKRNVGINRNQTGAFK
jgi:hypothetical protein